MRRVDAPREASHHLFVPTATMREPRMPIACAIGNRASTVMILPLTKSTSSGAPGRRYDGSRHERADDQKDVAAGHRAASRVSENT
jgi:hypothetical protein